MFIPDNSSKVSPGWWWSRHWRRKPNLHLCTCGCWKRCWKTWSWRYRSQRLPTEVTVVYLGEGVRLGYRELGDNWFQLVNGDWVYFGTHPERKILGRSRDHLIRTSVERRKRRLGPILSHKHMGSTEQTWWNLFLNWIWQYSVFLTFNLMCFFLKGKFHAKLC